MLPFTTVRGVLQFVVGLVVGASVVAALMIAIAPSRRVRAEPPLPRDVETKLLLGEDPDQIARDLQACIDEHISGFALEITVGAYLDPFDADPRCNEMFRRLNLVQPRPQSHS